jgi:glycosyltransferase involved in cell wall biosynthesis
MTKTKILYVLHNHPIIRPGGSEQYAVELYEAMKASEPFEPLLMARAAPNPGPLPSAHPGAPISSMPEDPNQYLVSTEDEGFDFFLGTVRDKSLYTTYLEDFLRAQKPDIVHFQHTHFFGYDLISLARRVLPHAPLLYTLHEFLPICHRDGQMLRVTGEPCTHETPRRCNECYPHMPRQQFFLRKQLIQTHFRNVDLFLAPSRFLLERYVDWGVPRDRIVFEDYGRLPVARVPQPAEDRPRNRLAFFGQVNRYKGLDVLLAAMRKVVAERPDVQLQINGANLEIQPESVQSDFLENVEELKDNVTFAGPYDHASLPGLMAAADWVMVPSRWWENSPLVIQEAFAHRRPVICSDIGGMAEKVEDGVTGLHFRARDPHSLADTIEHAIGTPELWHTMRAAIRDPHPMHEHVARMTELYEELLSRRGVDVNGR